MMFRVLSGKAFVIAVFILCSVLSAKAYANESVADNENRQVDKSGSDGAEVDLPPLPMSEPQVSSATGEEAEKDKKPLTREVIDNSVDDFFDAQTNELWQYMHPILLLQTGAVYEQWDAANVVLRNAGFKLFNAKLGFKGALDKYRMSKDWDFGLSYVLSAKFASGAKIADAYVSAEIGNYWFSPRLKMGLMKVPFLSSELESDEKMYFFDRPQYVHPYGSDYLTDIRTIGLGREIGTVLRLGFFDTMLNFEGGVFYTSSKPKEQVWKHVITSIRAEFDSKKLFHEKVRLRVGGAFFNQDMLPLIFENSRYSFATDARLDVWGAFVGGEWALQITDDGINEEEYRRLNYKNNISQSMGYMVYAGYSFPKREYELAVRYQWFDPDDTNVMIPIPQSANQSRRWISGVVSWWPINLVRLMLQYTHKQELEATAYGDYTESRLKDIENDEVVFTLQVSL